MPARNNQLQWLQTRQRTILGEISQLENDTDDPIVSEALSRIVELMEINQQIQGIYAIHIMASQKQSEQEIDDQLNEIAGYLESIISSRQREAENLRKIQ